MCLRDKFSNSNYVGTHFGGNLYAMIDPFYMLMIMKNVGDRYYVWDIEAQICFLKPGKGELHSVMELSDIDLKEIKEKTKSGEKYIKTFTVSILSKEKDVICKIKKLIYIRLKPNYRP